MFVPAGPLAAVSPLDGSVTAPQLDNADADAAPMGRGRGRGGGSGGRGGGRRRGRAPNAIGQYSKSYNSVMRFRQRQKDLVGCLGSVEGWGQG
jgi:hypothetical protein